MDNTTTKTDQPSPATGTQENRPDDSPKESKPPESPAKKWFKRLLIAAILLAAVVGGGLYYEINIAPYESTDDAFIEGHVTTIAAQVPGRVVRLLVDDNQMVKANDVLLEIDPRDYEAKLAEARAELAEAQGQVEQAKGQLAVDQAKVEEENANVAAAQADATRAEADRQRYEAIASPAVSRSQIDQAEDQARTTAAQLVMAKSRVLAASAQVSLSQAGIVTAQAAVERAQALVTQADLDLSDTKVTALEDGYVTRRTVEQGAYIQTGQPLLAIVPAQIWIVANFKETQLKDMRRGQPVEIEIDAYPQHIFKGHVDSIQSGSGARFSLLPPENATGNYVKVVQRVPVKIVLDETPDADFKLGPGMSVAPKVRVR